jgi:hypothetical protein
VYVAGMEVMTIECSLVRKPEGVILFGRRWCVREEKSKIFLKKWSIAVWTALIWFAIRYIGGLLLTVHRLSVPQLYYCDYHHRRRRRRHYII